jgi:hypothetical protein
MQNAKISEACHVVEQRRFSAVLRFLSIIGFSRCGNEKGSE